MYVVSCRRGFDSDQFTGAENRFRNYTNPTNAATFTDLTMTDVVAKAKNKHVCVLVHGFHNQMGNVMNAYWEIVERMNTTGVVGPEGYGLVIGFTWPGMATSLGYFTAMLSAKRAAPYLLDLVNALRGEAHTVDVQTHSLGARVALTALKNPKKVFVDNLILSAPAVDNHLLEPEQDFFPAMDSCNRCMVYHSRQDSVLGGAYPLADIADGVHKALGRGGPRSKATTMAKTPNVYVVDCTSRVKKDHSGYRKADEYFKHWKRVLSGDAQSRYDELS
jgi:esterase/lipase superfamily enzyme